MAVIQKSGPVDLFLDLRGCLDRDEPLPPHLRVRLSDALDETLKGANLEAALGLAGGWRANAKATLRSRSTSGTDEQTAAEWIRILTNYERRHYKLDAASSIKPAGDRRVLYDMLTSFGGKVPALRSMQRYLSGK